MTFRSTCGTRVVLRSSHPRLCHPRRHVRCLYLSLTLSFCLLWFAMTGAARSTPGCVYDISPAPMTALERPVRHSQPLASAFSSCRRRLHLPPIRSLRCLRQLVLAPPLNGWQSEHGTKQSVIPTPAKSRLPFLCLLRWGGLRSSRHINSDNKNQSRRRIRKRKSRQFRRGGQEHRRRCSPV